MKEFNVSKEERQDRKIQIYFFLKTAKNYNHLFFF